MSSVENFTQQSVNVTPGKALFSTQKYWVQLFKANDVVS